MAEIPKMCRFCLQQEKLDINCQLVDVSGQNFESLRGKIRNSIGICITLNNVIPPFICKNCLATFEQFCTFVDKIKKSEKILYNLYPRTSNRQNILHTEERKNGVSREAGQIDEDLQKDNVQGRETIPGVDEFISCDSDSASETKSIFASNRSQSSSPDFKNGSRYPSLGESVSLLNANENFSEKEKGNAYTCNICFKDFDSFFDYQDHQFTHDGHFVFCCSKCEEVFPTRDKLVEHDKAHKITCNICNIEVLPKSLAAHMKKHTDKYRCTGCNSRHTSKAALDKHYKARHIGVKGYICHICGKQNSCQSSMKRHIATHNLDRPYKCKFCTFSAKSKTVLRVHIQRKHTGQKGVCEICAKMFKSELSLQQHIKRIHGLKKYKCTFCSKAFSEKFNLDKHVLKKHTKQRLHECKLCRTEFLTVKKLKEHMYSHKKGCESCPYCGKLFSYKKMLQKHIITCMKRMKADIKSSLSMPNTTVNCDE